MANASIVAQKAISNLLDIVNEPSFQYSCLAQLQNLSASQWQDGVQLINGNGMAVSTFDDSVWGMTYATCNTFCGGGAFSFPFSYASFANAMTNYLLPWLALTAQLPYEAGESWPNVLSFFLAVGSPALIAYSLTLTILNRAWARKVFNALRSRAKNLPSDKAPWLAERIRAVQFLMQEGQQVPLRASQTNGQLASLIALPQNEAWWRHVRKSLKGTRRGITPSLVAQMALAVVAWFLTLIAAFVTALGDPDTANEISYSTLWMWLIPVVLGWVMVGTQIKSRSIEKALDEHAWIAVPPSETPLPDTIPEEVEIKSLTRSPTVQTWESWHQQARRVSIAQTEITTSRYVTLQEQKGIYCRKTHDVLEDDDELGDWHGLPIGGDEELKGAAFNYARVFTWWQLADTARMALRAQLRSVNEGIVCQPSDQVTQRAPVQWHSHNHENNYRADSVAITKHCGLAITTHGAVQQPQALLPYVPHNRLPAQLKRRILIASLAALLVQWGTAGDSIMRAYLTQPIGLGCRSGSYLVYALTSTVAWILLLVATLLSHDANVLHQDQLHKDTEAADKDYQRSLRHTATCAAAVIFRLTGHTLCVLNGLWLLITSLMEIVGGFDTCWCQTNYPITHGNSWIMLFKTGKDLALGASLPWGGGLAMTVAVIALILIFFALGTSRADEEK